MLKIGLTGGICTGKSLAAGMLTQRYGIAVIDGDPVAHQLLEKGEAGYQPVLHAFGESILHTDGTIHRQKLGDLVFADPTKLKTLNAIIHPLVRERIRRQEAEFQKRGDKVVVVSIALLFEAGVEGEFDERLIVMSNRELQFKRLVQERKMNPEKAKQILDVQWSNERRIKLSNCYKIWNNGGLKELEVALFKVWDEILKKHKIQ